MRWTTPHTHTRAAAPHLRLTRTYVAMLTQAFVAFVERLHAPGQPGALPTLHAPSFSHAEKDPVAGGITILPSHKIVLVEGLYCNLSVAPWDRAAACWDMRWLLTIDEAEARARLTRRHVEAGLAPTPDAARHRGTSHDSPSGYQ